MHPAVKAISFTGGEPLLRLSLVLGMLNKIKETPVVTTLNTNGWFLDMSTAKSLKDAGLGRVQVSIDSSIPEKHDSFRGTRGSHERALSAIENCFSKGIDVYARVTITSFNFNELREILHIVMKRGGQGIIVKPLVPSGRGKNIDETLSREQHMFAVTSLLEAIKSDSQIEREHVQFLTPSYPFLLGSEFVEYSDCCDCGEKLAFVASTGDVQPCGYTHYILGNLRERTLEEIWNDAPFLREWREKRVSGKCVSCEFADICRGGCRAAAFETTGRLDIPDPLCWR